MSKYAFMDQPIDMRWIMRLANVYAAQEAWSFRSRITKAIRANSLRAAWAEARRKHAILQRIQIVSPAERRARIDALENRDFLNETQRQQLADAYMLKTG